MTLRLFYSPHIIPLPSLSVLLLLLLLLLCVPMCTANDSPTTDTVEIFNTEEKVKPSKTNGDAENKEISVKTFYSPFIVAADDMMIALAEVNYTEQSDSDSDSSAEKTELLTKYIEMKKKGETSSWVENVMKKEKDKNWKAQFATKDWKKAFVVSSLKNSTADATNEKKTVYFIAINGTAAAAETQSLQYDFMIVNGTISSTSGEKKIEWDLKKFNSNSLKNEFVDKLFETSPFVSLAFFVHEKNNRIIFAVTGKGKESNSNKYISALIEITQNMGELELLNVTDIAEDCYPYFFSWEGKVIMIPTICSGNTNTVMKEFNEENDKKKEWENHGGSLSRLINYLRDKRDFTTASIDNHNAILFTEHKTKTNKKYDVNLLVSDGKRLKSVGSITSDVDSVTHMDFLYTGGELFSLHNQSKDDKNKNILTHLKKQLKTITDALDAWEKSDAKVSKLCGTELTTVKDSCSDKMSTEGIVGFLSNNTNTVGKQMYWKDEYLYVNATVTEGTKVDNGFKFDKVGARAKWLMGKITDNQPYNFTDSGFTLVATVTVDSVGKDNSVLGVSVENKKNIIGLLCAKEGKWNVISDGGQTAVTENLSCVKGESYKVTLTLSNENGEGTVYVDGKKLSASGKDFTIKKDSENSFYFYFGADESQNDVDSCVTVTNVLLYNRPFLESEIEKLKIIKQEKPKESSSNSANHTDSQDRTQKDRETTGGSSGNGDSSDTTDKDTKIADMTSSSQPESSTLCGGVGCVFLTLLFLLFDLYGCYLR